MTASTLPRLCPATQRAVLRRLIGEARRRARRRRLGFTGLLLLAVSALGVGGFFLHQRGGPGASRPSAIARTASSSRASDSAADQATPPWVVRYATDSHVTGLERHGPAGWGWFTGTSADGQ